jgi:hypothetical protein
MFKLHRRTVLRGLGGVAVGLPFLEIMRSDRPARAQLDPGGVPRRYAIVFAGQALGGDDWAEDAFRIGGESRTESGHFIVPSEVGGGYSITTPLQPLEALRNDFSLVSNLRIPYSTSSTEGGDVPEAGAYRDFHGGGCSPLISGTRSTEARFTANGITSDQVIANLHAGMTARDSLVYRAQPSWYLSGSSYAGREYISYRGARDPIDAFTSPRLAFMDLFGGFMPDDMGAAGRQDFERRARQSVLDLILGKRDRLLARVGAADRVRLERHFDEIRALEQRIAAIPPPATGECAVTDDPGADDPIGGDNPGSGSDSIRSGTGYSNEEERGRVFADLIHMAFVCDLTRAATLQLTTFQSHMNVIDITTAMGTPVRADLHEVGHNGDVDNRGQLPVSLLLQWHIAHYAYLMQKLKDTPEGDGNVLDNSVLVFMPEAGHGRQLNDASSPNATHSVERMILLVGGRAGGLMPGRHIDSGGAHPGQALVSAMQAAGYAGESFGEVTGNVSDLFG